MSGEGRLRGGRNGVKRESFGQVYGRAVELYTLTNAHGVEARITSYGGILVSLSLPDRAGYLDDVVLGFDKLDDYLTTPSTYFGALIGRYGNRISKGRFTLDGVERQLTANDGANHLHGGVKGFDKVVWAAKPSQTGTGPSLELGYLSHEGEEGYPGNLSVRVIYTLTNRNELKLDYFATTDSKTIVNLTHHSYFNLAGQGNGSILDHQLMINAGRFTPVDEGLIPTGELRRVQDTPFDFTRMQSIGARINQDEGQLKFGTGYDHNWVLEGPTGRLRQAAKVYEPVSGRVMEVRTTEPGLQFYSGNFLDGTLTGKGGKVYHQRYGFCLEPQHFPDSPNKPGFPSTVLKRGELYRTTTVYKFSTQKDG